MRHEWGLLEREHVVIDKKLIYESYKNMLEPIDYQYTAGRRGICCQNVELMMSIEREHVISPDANAIIRYISSAKGWKSDNQYKAHLLEHARTC